MLTSLADHGLTVCVLHVLLTVCSRKLVGDFTACCVIAMQAWEASEI